MTDAQVLTQLKKKKVRLLMQLERVDVAIKAFQNIDVKEIESLELLAYDDDMDIDVEAESEKDMRNYKQYNPRMTNEQKVFWALAKMGTATAVELSDFLMHQDESLKNRTLVVRAITYSTSRMFNAGKIEAEKRGYRNYYRMRMTT